jgi:hypothetical protein
MGVSYSASTGIMLILCNYIRLNGFIIEIKFMYHLTIISKNIFQHDGFALISIKMMYGAEFLGTPCWSHISNLPSESTHLDTWKIHVFLSSNNCRPPSNSFSPNN